MIDWLELDINRLFCIIDEEYINLYDLNCIDREGRRVEIDFCCSNTYYNIKIEWDRVNYRREDNFLEIDI